jgi:hypothetical protein
MHRGLQPRLAVLTVLSLLARAAAQEAILCAFDRAEDLRQWEVRSGTATVAALPDAPDRQGLRLEFDPAGEYQPAYLTWSRVQRDWSGFDALILDVFNPSAEPLPGYVLVADQAWADKGRTYWNRHNAETTFAPGRTEWRIPVRGLFRGEAGSRNNDIARNLDPDAIVRLDFGFGERRSAGVVWLSNLRLVKAERAAGVFAFDFGPPAQSVMLGWTPVSQTTGFTAEQGYGWGPQGGRPWDGAARDTTFGPALTQDFCEARNYTFRVAVPAGTYRVLFILENSGYWGGEQAKHTWRQLLVNGERVWREDRPDGAAHGLLRFEDVEPVGLDLWETYMLAELTRPVEVTVTSTAAQLDCRFEADQPWGCKLAALAVHRADDAAARAWLDGQMGALAREFRQKAVCLDPPAPPFAASPEWSARGLVAWPLDIEDTVTPTSLPPETGPLPATLRLDAPAVVRGEVEPLCLAIRPLQDLGEGALAIVGDLGEGVSATTAVVHYNTSRGFNSIAYRIRPHTVRPAETVRLAAGVTREVIVTLHVDAQAKAGRREAALVLRSAAGQELLRVPLAARIRAVTLDRNTPFQMGFFGLLPPDELGPERSAALLDETLVLLRQHGANAVSGGPDWRLTGWAQGEPILDTAACDRFFARLRQHGFTGAINGYGGLRFEGLHERYTRGDTAARVEKESGRPYEQAFARAWEALDRHARSENWPTLFYAMCDETRVRQVAEAELEFMKLMAGVSARFPATVRTSGSYSVSFAQQPKGQDDLLYWHQEFFKALDISSLNTHDESVTAEARRLGKTIHLYNQGRSRFAFGLYPWGEARKGVAARWEWHLNILHGYQFFDLDGREPDTAMICYGRKAIYPTIEFERCREGAEDFYLCNTLSRLLEDAGADAARAAAAKAARELLARLDGMVALNQRTPPAGYRAAELKAELVQACEALLPPP